MKPLGGEVQDIIPLGHILKGDIGLLTPAAFHFDSQLLGIKQFCSCGKGLGRLQANKAYVE